MPAHPADNAILDDLRFVPLSGPLVNTPCTRLPVASWRAADTPTDARLIELTAINRRLRELLNCCPDLGLGMADIPPNEEKALSDRVDAVCNDLLKGTVPPRQVDQLADAVRRNRQDAAVGRALRFSA